MDEPTNPISAVTHPDPYTYYARLVAQAPLEFDETLNLWVAASAAAVEAVMSHPAARVRPVGRQIPESLEDSPAGAVFGRFVRMNDGPRHEALRAAVAAALAGCAPGLWESCDDLGDNETLDEAIRRLPLRVVGRMMGVAEPDLPGLCAAVENLLPAMAPSAGSGEARAAAEGACALSAMLRKSGGNLARNIAAGLPDHEDALANLIGLLVQSRDATAGLIGAAMLALRARPDAAMDFAAPGPRATAFLREVARHDAPIQNTRRFLAADAQVFGRRLMAGDTVLVLLAAANRDPAANPEPHAFRPLRHEPRCYTFGLGGHRCPGQAIASAIAGGAIRALLRDRAWLTAPWPRLCYQPSANARILLPGATRRAGATSRIPEYLP